MPSRPGKNVVSFLRQPSVFVKIWHIFVFQDRKMCIRDRGRIVTFDALCEALWGENPFGYENSLNAHVRRVREKIEADPSHPVSLITVKGLGYKLIVR